LNYIWHRHGRVGRSEAQAIPAIHELDFDREFMGPRQLRRSSRYGSAGDDEIFVIQSDNKSL